MSADGTRAKDIVLHYFRVTQQKITPRDMARYTLLAKSLLDTYSDSELICEAISALYEEVGTKLKSMYFFNYHADRLIARIIKQREVSETPGFLSRRPTPNNHYGHGPNPR